MWIKSWISDGKYVFRGSNITKSLQKWGYVNQYPENGIVFIMKENVGIVENRKIE